ncbi:translation initiation factor eIF 4e-like domain-containing protein [Umbelopsis sp. PMI_123]|nr:translation initiation factor eIF 4e-like domain-containing protein [Umbelopsis sp. PMI_123]
MDTAQSASWSSSKIPNQLIDNYNTASTKRPNANINLSPMTPLFASSTTSNHLSSKLVKTPSEGLSIKLLDQQVPEDQKHPLHYTWVFWFMHRPPGAKITNYESGMKKIASVSSIEDYWAVYSHLKRPKDLPNISDYHLFKQGVRPVWEDTMNVNGGKWIVRLKKGLASRYWESLVMAILGDQFDVGQEICGAVLSIRNSEDILSVWNQSAHEGRTNLKIRDTMKKVLNLPADTIMEYKTHNDSLNDHSSFRNTDIFR